MNKFSQLAETLIGSEIVKLGNAIKERIQAGETIFNYTIGDFDPKEFPIPKALEQAIIKAYQNGYTNYPTADGEADLRNAVSHFIKTREGLDYAPNQIQIAAGGRPLIYTIFKAVVDKGDKVIYSVPSWNNNHYTHLTEAEHCVIETTVENNFMPTADAIAPHLPGAALLCLCTPQNPTGTVIDKTELEKICALVIAENKNKKEGEKKLYVMFDQMYWTLTFGDTQHYNPVSLMPEMKNYTVFVSGISKMFAATGVRVGWSMGPTDLIAKMKAILSHVGAWAPMAEQKAVAHYLMQEDLVTAYLNEIKESLHYRLTHIYKGFQNLKAKGFAVDAIAPQAAIYLTVQFDLVGKKTHDGTVLSKQEDVTAYLLAEAKLAIVPFSAFGAGKNSTWYRLSVGTCKKSDIPVIFSQLENALNRLS